MCIENVPAVLESLGVHNIPYLSNQLSITTLEIGLLRPNRNVSLNLHLKSGRSRSQAPLYSGSGFNLLVNWLTWASERHAGETRWRKLSTGDCTPGNPALCRAKAVLSALFLHINKDILRHRESLLAICHFVHIGPTDLRTRWSGVRISPGAPLNQ